MASIKIKTANAKPKTSAQNAGNRQAERRGDGQKPGGTKLDSGGGSAAKKSKAGASGSRGKGGRST
ncbi:MAG TPA: hypothetical protein VF683_05055 [Chthoniobacterales bacterium]|jgi:hypothetical protein